MARTLPLTSTTSSPGSSASLPADSCLFAMAEVLGVAVNIIAVIQITEDVIKLCVEYASSVKDARSEMQNIRTECESVRSVLERLHAMCTDPKFCRQMPSLQLLMGEDGPLSQYQDKLKELVAELQLPKGWKGAVGVVGWPMKAKRINKALQIMVHKKAILTLAISMDSALLSTVLAANLSHQAESLDVISGNVTAMTENMATVVDATDAIMHGIIDGLYNDIIRWLSPPDPSSNHNDACKKRHPETGKWFLDGEPLQRWKIQPSSLLWLYGIPGAGKSVLCSTIIDHISGCCAGMPSVAVAYFYFDFNDVEKQNPDNFLRSLIVQLLTSVAPVPECISLSYKKHRDGRQPSTYQLLMMLRSLIELNKNSYLFGDALDECADLGELLRIIKEIVNWKLGSLHFLITSRKERQLSDNLDLIVTEQTSIQGSFVDSDISNYIRGRLQDDARMRKWSDSIQNEIAEALAEGAEGMFRWAACQLDTLSVCRKLDQVRAALRSLPKDLDETYNRILSKISPEDERDVKIVLQWLAFSARPVQLNEVAEALAIEYSNPPRFNPQQRLPKPLDILTMCSSLVTISEPNYDEFSDSHCCHQTQELRNVHANMHLGTLRLAHYSVKEFLISDGSRKSQTPVLNFSLIERSAHQVIAETCLLYLLNFNEDSLDVKTHESFPLAKYAAENWPFHARFGNGILLHDLQPLLLRLFRPYCNQFLNWVRIHDIDDEVLLGSVFERSKSTIAGPAYYSCLLGLFAVVEHLVNSGTDINELGGGYGNCLQAASYQGNSGIVRLLLENGANVNVMGGKHGNALQATCESYEPNENIVRLLIESGADVNAEGGKYGNALQAALCASYEPNENIVRLLIESGADVNAEGVEYGNALQAALCASYKPNENIVRLLIESGADVNAEGGKYGNALQAALSALYEPNENIVRLLIESGADVNAEGGKYRNALQAALCASYEPNENIVQLLIESGADVNSEGGWYGNALQAALCVPYEPNEKIVRLLIESGADVNAEGGKYGNALQAALCASYEPNESIVRLLIESGADVNAEGGEYRNALQAAVCPLYGPNENIVRLLLETGVNVNAEGGKYGNALQAAALKGNEAIVRLLLDGGADVNAKGGTHGNALQAACTSYGPNEKIVRLLIESGADVNAEGGEYGNALQAALCASYEPNENIVRLLIESGADVNAEGGEYGNALQAALCASYEPNENIVRLLIESGADVNAEGGKYGNALQAAVCTSYGPEPNEDIVRLLLETGVNVNAEGGKYGNALQAAALQVDDANVRQQRLLLDGGADGNAKGGTYGNALQAAALKGNKAIVRLLTESGADVMLRVEGTKTRFRSWNGGTMK